MTGLRRLPLAIGCLCALTAGLVVWRSGRDSPERNLGRIYGQRRTLELRIPGAAAGTTVPRPTIRGMAAGNESAALLLEEGRIARQAEQHPDDPHWMQLRARAALLRWDYDFAIGQLEHIRLLESGPQAAMPDLAIAYFERAEALDRPEYFAEALEYLAADLRLRPDEPETLFNCGVLYQKLQLPLDAEEMWQRYLKVQPGGAWADEVRTRLAAVRAQSQRLQAAVPASDDSLLASADYRAVSTSRADEFVARHGDRLLIDLLASPSPPGALDALASAGRSNGQGDPDGAIPSARQAIDAFRAAGNPAAAERSNLELVYALQRASKPCRVEAADLVAELKLKPYPWLNAQAMLALASCSTMVGDLGLGRRLTEEAQRQAEAAGYPILALRSLGLLSAEYGTLGLSTESWEACERGLRQFWSGTYPGERGYQFYYTLSQTADAGGFRETSRSFLSHAVATIETTPYRSLEAIARQRLARAESLCERYEQAISQLQRAAGLFGGLPQTETVQFYRTDGEIGVLGLEAHRGKGAEALRRLQELRGQVAGHAGQLTAMKFYQALAEVERQAGDLDAARGDLSVLIATAERALATIAEGRDRLSWATLESAAYRQLTAIELDGGNFEKALENWEWSRAADIRDRHITADLSEVRRLRPSLTGETIVSYVQLDDRLGAWLYDDRGVHFVWLSQDVAAATRLAKRFTDLCADSRSSSRELEETSRRLFALLIAPMSSWLEPRRKLVVEMDGAVTTIPFEALRAPEGWLGQRTAIETSAGIYYRGIRHAAASVSGPALVVGAPALAPEIAPDLPPLPGALREARGVAGQFSHAKLLTGPFATVAAVERELPSASLFHFAGHGFSRAGQSILLLAPATGGAAYFDAGRVSAIDLHRCALVVLSGCSTGRMQAGSLSDPDNLVRAFLSSGAGAVVAARWDADSDAAESLMERFYRELRRDADPARALQVAESALRAETAHAHPFYWAAFTVFANR